jgi:hypothetical protein
MESRQLPESCREPDGCPEPDNSQKASGQLSAVGQLSGTGRPGPRVANVLQKETGKLSESCQLPVATSPRRWRRLVPIARLTKAAGTLSNCLKQRSPGGPVGELPESCLTASGQLPESFRTASPPPGRLPIAAPTPHRSESANQSAGKPHRCVDQLPVRRHLQRRKPRRGSYRRSCRVRSGWP